MHVILPTASQPSSIYNIKNITNNISNSWQDRDSEEPPPSVRHRDMKQVELCVTCIVHTARETSRDLFLNQKNQFPLECAAYTVVQVASRNPPPEIQSRVRPQERNKLIFPTAAWSSDLVFSLIVRQCQQPVDFAAVPECNLSEFSTERKGNCTCRQDLFPKLCTQTF